MSKIEIIVKLMLKSNFDACYLIIRFWDFSLRERHIWCEHALCLKQFLRSFATIVYTVQTHIMETKTCILDTINRDLSFDSTKLKTWYDLSLSLNWPELRSELKTSCRFIIYDLELDFCDRGTTQNQQNNVFFMIPPTI